MVNRSKYTDEIAQRICEGIQLGMPYYQAAMYGGVSMDTFARWRDSKAEFADAIKAAESKAIAGRLARIRQAEPEHWQAAAWWLGRRYPNDFGKTVQEQQHTGKDGAPFEIVIRRDDA